MEHITRNIKQVNSKNRGFSLLEVITAIFILTVGIGGSFSLIYQTLSVASATSLRLTASYLAQEGIELTKNLRDNAWLAQRGSPGIVWNEFIPNTPGGEEGWEADYRADILKYTYVDSPLYIDATTGFYRHFHSANGEVPGPNDIETKFRRKIIVQDLLVVDPDKREVMVEVTWQERGRSHSVQISEIITNWLPVYQL
jgi:prepilin-type N-terminal cleavage/methylation domain-containing protein